MAAKRSRRSRSAPRRRRAAGESKGDSESGRPGSRSPSPRRAAGPNAGSTRVRDPYLGRTVGGYTILERLQTGETTITFKAEQPAMGRLVTFELLTEEAAADDDTLLAFYRSARFAAKVQHPNLLGIYDVSSAENVHYCASEYAEGRTVGEILRSREKLPTDDAIRVATDVAEALRAANAAGVPGVALSFDRVTLTQLGEIKLRLPTLTAPDATVLGGRYVQRAAGVLLYALLSSGRVPDAAEAVHPDSDRAANLPPLKRVAMGTRQDVAEVVDRLLGRGDGASYRSVEAALDALRGLLEAPQRVESRRRSSTDRARRRESKSKLYLGIGLGIAGLAFAVILVVLLSSGAAARRVRNAYADAHGRARALVQQAHQQQKQFNRAPTPGGIQGVVAAYQRAIEPYQEFMAAHPEAAEARQAARHIEEIRSFIPVFRANARRRLRHAALNRDLRALREELNAEIEEKKKTGGTLQLARWRARFAALVEAHGGGSNVTSVVEQWLDALPGMIRRGQMAIDAEQVIRTCQKNYIPKENFAACLKAWDQFVKEYQASPTLREEAKERRDEELNKVRRGAALAYHRLEGEAKRLAANNDYQGARAIYQRVVRTFGFESLVQKARRQLAKLPKG
jgi:hypothetical protein